MDSQKPKDPRVMKYLQYCAFRYNDLSEGEVATKLGAGSPQALYQILARDGFPVCKVCGETPVNPDHCSKRGKRRRARGETDPSALDLPPARRAIPLFEGVIGSLHSFSDGGLHHYCEDLRHLEEKIHGKRFTSNLIFENEAGFKGTLRREDYSNEEWSALCEGLSQDPRGTEAITPYDVPSGPGLSVLGARRTPAEQLVVLIAVYALMRKNLDPLVDSLHPEPSLSDRQQLESVREDLRLAAEQMATLVRGGKVGRGAPVEGLSRSEASLAYRITDLKNRGLSYAQIQEHLNKARIQDGPTEYGHEISREEVERLGGFDLHFPDF